MQDPKASIASMDPMLRLQSYNPFPPWENVLKIDIPTVATLALGLWPRQGLARLWAKRRKLGVKESVREWTVTFPREFPPWELESRWTFKCSKSDYRGQNPMDWVVLYTIENLLKRRCLKWARITHLDIWNTSYGQKKGHESNWQFDSRPLKVGNRPDFVACKWRARYFWKAFDESYNFASDIISIRGLHAKLWGPKIVRVPTLGISRLLFGSLETKCHVDVGLVKRHIVYYKGEGGGFPQVRAVVSLMSPSLPVAHPSTKSAPTTHKPPCVWFCAGLCK